MRAIDPATAELSSSLRTSCSALKQNLAICLTLYNETAELLRPSLESIVDSLDDLGTHDPSYKSATICIIADGSHEISKSSGLYLESLQLSQMHRTESKLTTDISSKTFPARQPVDALNRSRPSQMAITVKLITKTQNAGKLDSHRLFYDLLCPQLNPDYCFQIDAGTLLDRSAFYEMCALFESDAKTAGIASNVLIAPPSNRDVVQSFQCGDFAVQKTIRWPSEVFSGYLSVLPGQFSAVRWRTFSQSPVQGELSPKDRYLRGQICRSAAESMMYLSEDRVLGFELATQKGAGNKLGFAPKAVCHTDACNTISELLLQRRRWLNGSLFCRSWMIAKIFHLFADKTYSFAEKARFGPALFNLSAQHLLEWFLPLLNILLLAMTWVSLSNVMPSTYSAFCLFAPIATIWLSPTVLAMSGHLQHWPATRVQGLLRLVSLTFFAVIAINVTNLSQQPEMTAYLYYLSMPLALASGAFIGAAILNRAIIPHLRSSILTFISLAPSLWLMMSTYAFFNLHDGSWGTKGLSGIAGAEPSKREVFSDQFRRLRRYLVSAWVVSNGALIVILLETGNISPALMVAGTLQITLITSGLLGAISTRIGQSDRLTQHANPIAPRHSVPFSAESASARPLQSSGSQS